MKIIDLLNKIANNEDVPKKIKYKEDIYTFNNNLCDYEREIGINLFTYYFSYIKTTSFINDEVEIIENNNKIEKLKTTDDRKIFNTISNNYNQLTNWGYLLANKINEIIDKLEEVNNENSNIR